MSYSVFGLPAFVTFEQTNRRFIIFTESNDNAGEFEVSIIAVINNKDGTSRESDPSTFTLVIIKNDTVSVSDDGDSSSDDFSDDDLFYSSEKDGTSTNNRTNLPTLSDSDNSFKLTLGKLTYLNY
jgi:hypothetical protein